MGQVEAGGAGGCVTSILLLDRQAVSLIIVPEQVSLGQVTGRGSKVTSIHCLLMLMMMMMMVF